MEKNLSKIYAYIATLMCSFSIAYHNDPPYTLERLIALNQEVAMLIVRAQEAHQRLRNLRVQAAQLNQRGRFFIKNTTKKSFVAHQHLNNPGRN